MFIFRFIMAKSKRSTAAKLLRSDKRRRVENEAVLSEGDAIEELDQEPVDSDLHARAPSSSSSILNPMQHSELRTDLLHVDNDEHRPSNASGEQK